MSRILPLRIFARHLPKWKQPPDEICQKCRDLDTKKDRPSFEDGPPLNWLNHVIENETCGIVGLIITDLTPH